MQVDITVHTLKKGRNVGKYQKYRRMMGYLGAEAAVMYGTVPDDFLMDDVQCGGGEESLLHCR